MIRRVLGRSVFLTAFAGFLLLAAAWAFAMPYDGTADEFQHVVRAYGVLDGQIAARTDAHITVPQSLVPAGITDTASCMRWHLDVSAACVGPVPAHPGDRSKLVVSGSGAANYNPVYYAVVGWPIKFWPDYRGIIAARLLTGALTSALLAGAVWIAARLRGPGRNGGRSGRFLIAGLIAAVTPVAINLTGAVNPSGVEIAAGVALWAALIAVVDGRDDSRRVFALLGVSAVLLAVLREFGIGWLGASLAIAAFGLTRGRFGELVRMPKFWAWTAVVSAAVLEGALWILLSTQGGIRSSTPNGLPPMATGSVVVHELTNRSPYYTNGLVGLTSYGDVAIPFPFVALWFAAIAILLVPALRRCGRRVAFQICALIAVPYAVLIAADVQARAGGFWLSQGRYALPMLVGAPLVAAYWLGRQEVFSPDRQRRLIRLFATVLIPIQAIGLWVTMIRFQHAFESPHPWLFNLFADTASINPFSGKWLPPNGPWLPAVLCLAGIGTLILFYRTLAVTGPSSAPGTPLPAADTTESPAESIRP